MQDPACHHEFTFALMMNRPGPFPRRVNPRLDDLQDEEVVLGGQFRIPDLAFQAGITFGDERGLDARGGHGREAKDLELVHGGAPKGKMGSETTLSANSTVGMLITHSRVALRLANEQFRLLTTQPTSGGVNSIIRCHDMGMTFARPARAVVSSTTGPGSSSR